MNPRWGIKRVGVKPAHTEGKGFVARLHSICAAAVSLLKQPVGGGAEYHIDPDKMGGGHAERLLCEIYSALSSSLEYPRCRAFPSNKYFTNL